MKVVFIAHPDTNGVSDVFHTFDVPENLAPEGLIDRWTSIAASSPVQPLIITGKDNLVIHSTWDPETELFSLGEGIDPSYSKPLDTKNVVFLANNKVVGILGLGRLGTIAQALEAGFSDPVTVMLLEDSSTVKPGDTWNGTSFTTSN